MLVLFIKENGDFFSSNNGCYDQLHLGILIVVEKVVIFFFGYDTLYFSTRIVVFIF